MSIMSIRECWQGVQQDDIQSLEGQTELRRPAHLAASVLTVALFWVFAPLARTPQRRAESCSLITNIKLTKSNIVSPILILQENRVVTLQKSRVNPFA
jgi:hypothetical protein